MESKVTASRRSSPMHFLRATSLRMAGYLADEIGGEQLLDDMYVIKEEFVGGLSFWPNINVQGLLQQIAAKAQTIRDGLPAEYPNTKQTFDALVTEMREAEPRCSDLYNFGFNKLS